jgi:hypothetical protein
MAKHKPTLKVKDTSRLKKNSYTNRRKNDPNEELYNSFANVLKDLSLELPMVDVIQIPTLIKFMRDILNRNKKIPEIIAVMTSYPHNEKLPAKQADPVIPTISCAIGKIDIHNA